MGVGQISLEDPTTEENSITKPSVLQRSKKRKEKDSGASDLKPKKRRKHNGDGAIEKADSSQGLSKKNSASEAAEDNELLKAEKKFKASQTPEDAEADVSEGKKRKKDRRKGSTDDKSETEVVSSKRKKHRNKTGFLDPDEDTALTDQARKALAYAFLQLRHPSKWKFNKARQNWLIRNVWVSEAIPETQLPLVVKYLTNVQGGVRETLIKTCRSILSPPDPEPLQHVEVKQEAEIVRTVHFEAPSTEEKSSPEADELKQARAQTMLNALI